MWRPVVGYEGIYEVRHSGEVYRVEGKNSRGYYQPYKEAVSELQPVWVDGKFVRTQTFAEVREVLKGE